DPAFDISPKWSPDGRQIAFLRFSEGGATIQLVSALGGPDRRVSDVRDADAIDWVPDGRGLAVGRSRKADSRGIYLIPIDGGDARPLIVSAPGHFDSQPAVSPDGRRLAYAHCNVGTPQVAGGCDVYLLELTA